MKNNTYLFNKSYLIKLLAAFAWLTSTAAYGQIIFSDNFDATPDWQSQGSQRCSWIGHDEASGSTDCADLPANYDLIYATDKNSESPMCEIKSAAGKGSNSKGLRFYDESNGDRNSWGSDCTIGKYLGQQYPEIWVSYYVRYNPNVIWGGLPSTKTLRIGHYNPLVVNGDAETNTFNTNNNSEDNKGLGATTAGLLFLNVKSSTDRVLYKQSARCGGTYKCGDYDDAWQQDIAGKTDASWKNTFGDNQWHHVEARMKMNSSIGAKDGVVEVYLDGNLQAKRSNTPWRLSGTKSNVTGFNMIFIGGNSDNVWAGQTNAEQYTYDFDDLTVCTSRCPTDGSSPLPPSQFTTD